MNGIIFLIIAYLLISLGAMVDKFILTKALPSPIAYAFLVSTFGLVAVFFAPFGFIIPAGWQIIAALVAGSLYTFAIIFLYKALRYNETSRITAFTGALVAVFTFIFSFLFLGERLSGWQIIAFIILVAGGVIISLESGQHNRIGKGFGLASIAGLIFAVSYTITKYVYSNQPFISGFIWIRIFAFLAILVILLPKNNYLAVKEGLSAKTPIRKRTNQLALLGGQVCTGFGFFLLNYAISLASASIILAAQGLQYAFVLIFAVALSKKFPEVLKEKMTLKILAQKIFAISLIGVGLIILTVNN